MPAAGAVQAVPSFPQLHSRWFAEGLGSTAFVLGGAPVTIQLDQAGYLDMILLHVQGNFTGATATLVLQPLSPWNIFSYITVQPPQATSPIRLGGFGLHLWNLIGKDFAPFRIGTNPAIPVDSNSYDLASIDVFPLTTGAQVWHLWYVIPFHRSSMDQRGLLPLGNLSRTNLVLTPAAKADLVTAAANLTLDTWTVTPYQCYFAPPSDGSSLDPFTNYAIWLDEMNQIPAATGDQKIVLDPNWTYLGLAHGVVLNGAMDSANISRLYLRANKADLTDQKGLDGIAQAFIQRRRHGTALPLGVVMYDEDRFVDDGSLDSRAWLYTDRLQTLESTITIGSGATLGASPKIYTWTRRLVNKNQAGFALGAG